MEPNTAAAQGSLLPSSVPLPLAFEDEGDVPIAYSLTPRARREVAPERMPSLRLVASSAELRESPLTGRSDDRQAGQLLDPTDVRPAQARALRRSGMPLSTIAAALGTDLELAERWTIGAVPVRSARRCAAVTPPAMTAAVPSGRVRPSTGGALGREAVGMAVALAVFDARVEGVGFTHARPEVLAAILSELRRCLPLEEWRVRVAIRVSEQLGVDRCRAATSVALGVDAARIVAGRWGDASAPDAMQISVQVADAAAARLVQSWSRGDGTLADEVRPTG
jgi:hypothetical protein